MQRIYLPLFWKFAAAIILVVLIFGSINISLIWTHTKHRIESETEHRLHFYAHSLAKEAASHLSESTAEAHLRELLVDMQKADSLLAYVIIVPGSDQPAISSLADNLPGLLQLNHPRNGRAHIQTFRLPQFLEKPVLDIAAPIPGIADGLVRVGLFRERIRTQMAILQPYVFMVLAFLFIGILGALFFSYVITRRVNFISRVAENFTFQNLKNGSIPQITKGKWVPNGLRLFEVEDELDQLSYQINSMISRLEKAYMDLEHTYARFVQTEKLASIGVLSAGVAHEINNPVAGIQNCIRRIKNHPTDIEKNQEYIHLIEEAVEKTRGVVGRLLDYSRSPQSVKQAVEPSSAIEKALLLVSYRLEKSRISIVKNIPHSNPPVYANQNELEQIFVNLFLNGIDAIDEQQRHDPRSQRIININVEQDEHHVLIKIADTGIGMTAAQQAKMYDPFFTTKDTGKGTGLGMYVVYNLVKSNDGRIWCHTQRYHGTEFTLQFLQARKVL